MLLGRVITSTIAGGIADPSYFFRQPEIYAYGMVRAAPGTWHLAAACVHACIPPTPPPPHTHTHPNTTTPPPHTHTRCVTPTGVRADHGLPVAVVCLLQGLQRVGHAQHQ
jgi:hypothetical protein